MKRTKPLASTERDYLQFHYGGFEKPNAYVLAVLFDVVGRAKAMQSRDLTRLSMAQLVRGFYSAINCKAVKIDSLPLQILNPIERFALALTAYRSLDQLPTGNSFLTVYQSACIIAGEDREPLESREQMAIDAIVFPSMMRLPEIYEFLDDETLIQWLGETKEQLRSPKPFAGILEDCLRDIAQSYVTDSNDYRPRIRSNRIHPWEL